MKDVVTLNIRGKKEGLDGRIDKAIGQMKCKEMKKAVVLEKKSYFKKNFT